MVQSRRTGVGHVPVAARWVPALWALAAMCLTAIAGWVTANDTAPLFRDPVAFFADYVPLNFAGFFSQLGLFCWWTCTLLGGMAWWAARRRGRISRRSRFLICWAITTAWLCFDDLVMFHEVVAATWFGIGEAKVYAVYAALVTSLGWTFRDVLAASDRKLLAASSGAFAFSILADLAQPVLEPALGDTLKTYLEDGAKFLGLVMLATWTTSLSLVELRAAGTTRH